MMNQGPRALPSQLGVRPSARLSAGFLSQSFTWMFAGLLLTAGVAWVVQSNARLIDLASGLFLPVILGQFALVMVISAAIRRLSALAALFLFFVYSATMGLTLSFIFLAYSFGTVASAFLSASAMFGGAAIYGAVTKRSLASMGGFLFMGVIGLLAAMVVNLFLHSSTIDWIVSILGIGIFTVLTAFNVQRIQSGDLAARLGSMEKAAVIGALNLYLDFLNLFLFFLRLSGGR
jgi:FtsH-binding integral membrane protein